MVDVLKPLTPAAYRFLVALAGVTVLVFGLSVDPARGASDQEALLQKAKATVESLRAAERPGDSISFKRRLAVAKGVVIVPELVKAGFIIGGEGGSGVIVGRNQGQWGYPAFASLLAASVGLQIGVQVSEVVFLVMTERGLVKLLKDKVKLGADAGIAIATVGVGVEGSTTTNADADILAFSRSKGLFGGVSFEGALLQISEDSNRAFYGKSATSTEIVREGAVANPKADPLRQALSAK